MLFAAAPLQSAEVAEALLGPSRFAEGGALQGWSVEDRLGSLKVPVLLARGKSDEIAPETTSEMQRAIPNAQVQTFVGGGCSHIDDWEYFLEATDNFLTGAEEALLVGSGSENA